MKFKFSNTALGRFRFVGITEGISYLLLLLIGMPVKYALGVGEVVKVMGWIHGVLFILYIITLINVVVSNKWSIVKTLIAFVASLIPFGTFWFDKQLREEEKMIAEQEIRTN